MTTHGFYTERISAKPSFYALYRSFTQCIFVEDEGDIVFYKNKQGEAQRHCGQEDWYWIGRSRIDIDGAIVHPIVQEYGYSLWKVHQLGARRFRLLKLCEKLLVLNSSRLIVPPSRPTTVCTFAGLVPHAYTTLAGSPSHKALIPILVGLPRPQQPQNPQTDPPIINLGPSAHCDGA